MKQTLLLVLVLLTGTLSKAQLTIIKERPSDYEYLSAPDSIGNRRLLETAVHSNSNTKIQSIDLKLPYPVIFIHGLNSNADTWVTMTNYISTTYGLKTGGRFDYCLNYNGSNTVTNTNFYPTIGADLAVFSGTWITGDYYYVNFDVGINGLYNPSVSNVNYVLSNQSAIVKQGKAIKDAIQRVLLLTGRDKVILVGHSMGGLASREYIQNPLNWQSDGKHHVAKLVTTGTPHGGSNATSMGILSGNTDGQSEAIRDLRRSYFYSENDGVYLFGGLENLDYMDDQLFYYFYTPDVNCNGTTQETITGLNNKDIYTNLDYACIIGECSGCLGTTNPGDGVVWNVCANLNNYYSNLTTNIFHYYGSALTEIHTDLPQQTFHNMQGMDEPDSYSLAYNVDFDNTYLGFTTVQAATNPNAPVDFDLYKFTVPTTSNVSININEITLPGLSANIVDDSYSIVGSTHSVVGSGINFSQPLEAGDYYLSIFGIETTPNYTDAYSFTINRTAITALEKLSEVTINVLVYPNPANTNFTIETNSNTPSTIELFDLNGRLVFSTITEEKVTIDVTDLNEGVYSIAIKTLNNVNNKKLVIVR